MSTTGKKGRFSVKILLRLFCLTGILFLSGCHLEKEPVAAPKEGRYLVYYLNGSGVNLIPRVYETEETDPLALSDELMEQLRYVPKDLECQTALGDKAVFRESRLDAGVLLSLIHI